MVTERLPRARVRLWETLGSDHDRLSVDLTESVSVISLQLPFAAIGSRSLLLREQLELAPALESARHAAKRLLDVVGSIVLIALALPVILAVGLAVLATSPGPVIYRHERIGKGGRTFNVWKFRSMLTDVSEDVLEEFAEKDDARVESVLYKSPNDPRLTSVGKLIRRTGLDELPQLFNVLAGSMSLVGPRPLVEEEIATLDPVEFHHRNSVRPGVTGLWQVLRRAETTFEERMRLDLIYVGCRTFWLDLYLLALTPLALVRGERSF